MKKFNKFFIMLLFVLLICGCGSEKEKEKEKDEKKDEPKEYISIMEYGDYKNIKLEDIDYIKVIKYYEGGDIPSEYKSESDIEEIYNKLLSYKVGDETEMLCEDNTTVYNFYMKNGNNYSIEIECNWFVIKNKRYLVK